MAAPDISLGAAVVSPVSVCREVVFLRPFGPVVEWLYRALQKLVHRFESGRDLSQFDHY